MSTVTISAFSPSINYPWPGTTATLRYTYSSDFVDSTGTPVMRGLYKDVACTVAGGVLTVPQHTIISTLDAMVNPLVTLSAQFLDEREAKRPNSWLFQQFQVPTTTPTTIGALIIFNQGSSLVLPPDSYLNAQEVQNLINLALGSLNFANAVPDYGVTALSVAPVSASSPIAVGDNDLRVNNETHVGAAILAYAHTYSSISSALTDIGVGGGTLVIATSQVISANLTIPSNVTLKFVSDGRLSINFGVVVTIQGPIEAPPKWIFQGTGTVVFTDNRKLDGIYLQWWGATGNGISVQDGVSTSASTTISSASSTFTSADVGKVFIMQGAGAAGAPLVGTISAILSATSFTSSVAAGGNTSGKNIVYGTDDTAAILAAYTAVPEGGRILLPLATYMLTSTWTLTKGIGLIGLGTQKSQRLAVGAGSSNRDQSEGVKFQWAGGATEMVVMGEAAGMEVDSIVFDGGRRATIALLLDRLHYSTFRFVSVVRGAVESMVIGGGSASGSDGSFWNTFYDLQIYGPTGLSIRNLGAGLYGGFHNRFYGLVIEYYGQGVNDGGLRLIKGDNNEFYSTYIWDHLNATPTPGVYIGGPWVNGADPYNNRFYGIQTYSMTVAAGNLYAGAAYGYDMANGETAPSVGAGSKFNYTVDGFQADLAGTPFGDGEWNLFIPTTVQSLTRVARPFQLRIRSGQNTASINDYVALAIGRTTDEMLEGISAAASTYVSGDVAGDLVIRLADAAKKIVFGFTDSTTVPPGWFNNQSLTLSRGGVGATLQFWKDGGPSATPSKAWSFGNSIPGGSVDNNWHLGHFDGATWVEKVVFTTGGALVQIEGAVLSVSSNTIAPTSPIHHVGAGLIKTITVPSGFTSGTIYLIPDSAFTYDATANIVGTGTAVVGRMMSATYSSSSSKWYMSY